jgi:hypothetical protein
VSAVPLADQLRALGLVEADDFEVGLGFQLGKGFDLEEVLQKFETRTGTKPRAFHLHAMLYLGPVPAGRGR